MCECVIVYWKMYTPSNSILLRLIKESKKSNMRCKHAAVIKYNKHPIVYGHNHMCNGAPIHAENHALARFFERRYVSVCGDRKFERILKKITIIVIRWNDVSGFVVSKPCSECIKALLKSGIQRVIYSDKKNTFKKENIKNIVNDHKTLYYKLFCSNINSNPNIKAYKPDYTLI